MGRARNSDKNEGLTLRPELQAKRNMIAARREIVERKRELEEINKPFYE